MASKYQLEQDLQAYENLKANLNKTVENLNTAGNHAEKIGPTINSNYTVNRNPSNIGERANNLADDITGTSNYVRNTIIPAIDNKIQEIEAEIRRIEEEERRAREEAERRAREAAEAAEAAAKFKANSRNSSSRVSGTTFRW